jgi:hypothetical protein
VVGLRCGVSGTAPHRTAPCRHAHCCIITRGVCCSGSLRPGALG